MCGGTGCSTRVEGLDAADCCATEIEDSGILCEDAGMAPCFIDDGKNLRLPSGSQCKLNQWQRQTSLALPYTLFLPTILCLLPTHW